MISGDLFSTSWYHMWFMFSLIAINRYVAVCKFGNYDAIFTHKRTTISVAASWILAIATRTYVLWAPCCRYIEAVSPPSRMGNNYTFSDSTYRSSSTPASIGETLTRRISTSAMS
ncbi:MAG: G-protein coupled receptor [Gammaproteobacteria bacterium]|nr:G-protein coupled receptor [Gammaproteobacteria bacterium]